MAALSPELHTGANRTGTTNSSLYTTMATGLRWKKGWLCAVTVIIGLTVMLYFISTTSKDGISRFNIEQQFSRQNSQPTLHTNWFWTHGYTIWPDFSTVPVISHDYFKAKCTKNLDGSITNLPAMLQEWNKSSDMMCLKLLKKFDNLFTVEARKATLSLPSEFRGKVSGWLGNKEELMKELFNQDIIHIVSKFSREHTVFNPLRAKRPVQPPERPEQQYFDEMLAKTKETCDFCNFRKMTAEHLFGRIESQHSFTASNVFKIESLHGLIALKSHDPLHWSKEQFLDVMSLTNTWMKKAKHHYAPAKFASGIWDVFPKCGASQVHPHIQIMFDPKRYHGTVESWRQGAQDYMNNYGSNYFTDLVGVYSALGLTASFGNATAFASLVPKKDHEVVVMSKEADNDFFTLLFYTLRAFIDDLHVFCYSMGLAYPGLGHPEGRIPAYARIITRGAVTDMRADISSLELFTATNVNIDPWKTIELVRQSVRSRRISSP